MRLVVPHFGAHQGGILDAVREVVEALALAVDVSRGAVQAAAERIGVAQVAGDEDVYKRQGLPRS